MATTLTMPPPRWQKKSSEFHSDFDFGHMNRRIDDALGQFRRAFQSRLSSEDLCPELLDHYGTFLPTEKRHSYKATLPDAPKIKPSSCLKRKRKTSTEEVDFGHIDQRIDDALGQFRRAFQSRLSSEDLCPELLNHYGTFLPTEKWHSYKATLPDAPKIEPSSCLKRKRKTSTEEVDFGHIDQRIDDVLGRFRRAFQCRLHSKTLCLELDEYGTLLPPYDWDSLIETPPDASKIVSSTFLERKRKREESSKEDKYHGRTCITQETKGIDKSNITRTELEKSSGEVEHMDAVGDAEHAPILRDVSGESENEYILAESSLKEATKLKRAADHLKKAGDDTETNEIYIHSGIKFLRGAFLLDHCRPKEVDRRIHIYKSAASLFEYCASAYKRKGHTQAAALACKCMEVANFRIIQDAVGKHTMKNASGDTQNTPGLNQLVPIAIHMDSAMSATRRYSEELEASRKCISHKAGCTAEGLSAVENALNFSFHDVDGFLDLVKLALKEIVL